MFPMTGVSNHHIIPMQNMYEIKHLFVKQVKKFERLLFPFCSDAIRSNEIFTFLGTVHTRLKPYKVEATVLKQNERTSLLEIYKLFQ